MSTLKQIIEAEKNSQKLVDEAIANQQLKLAETKDFIKEEEKRLVSKYQLEIKEIEKQLTETINNLKKEHEKELTTIKENLENQVKSKRKIIVDKLFKEIAKVW